ncbi:MAG: YmdB family metallophosphoesterase, partial [Actinomycetia bacterium]|nr:YmdB family metallophosphoesterase [Actinomycetes bacterium]
VVGTHTHVQTADEKILEKGTAYITDIGMTGPLNSVIGVDKDIVLQRFLTQIPVYFTVASGDVMLNSVVISVDCETLKAISIHRVNRIIEYSKK